MNKIKANTLENKFELSSEQKSSDIGKVTEDIAYQYLKDNGLSFIAKNFSYRLGEIDLIMKHKDCVVFIEVRYRKNSNYGYPEETISEKKQRKIKSTALLFIAKNSTYKNVQVRFDVVALMPNKTNNLSINWIQNAF